MKTAPKKHNSKLEIDRSPLSRVEKELMQGVRKKIAAIRKKNQVSMQSSASNTN